MKSFLMIIFGTTALFATITQAERKEISGLTKLSFAAAPDCDGRPEFITEVRPELIGGFARLPAQLVLVASEVDYYVESKETTGNLKMHSYQSFAGGGVSKQSKIVCATAKSAEAFRSSLIAPTIIDTTPGKKVGQSLWQFQMLADKEGFSVWNTRSLAFEGGTQLENELMKFGGSYRVYQLTRDRYEVVVSKEAAGVTQYLSVKYDATKSF